MFKIETVYCGEEITVESGSEKDAKRELAREKRKIKKGHERKKINSELAYTRSRESVCRIAEKIQRCFFDGKDSNWVLVESKPQTVYDYKPRYKTRFSNQYGYAEYTFDENPGFQIEAVDGTVGIYDFETKLWYGIGICEGEIAFTEVPSFISEHIDKFQVYKS